MTQTDKTYLEVVILSSDAYPDLYGEIWWNRIAQSRSSKLVAEVYVHDNGQLAINMMMRPDHEQIIDANEFVRAIQTIGDRLLPSKREIH